MSIEYRTGGHTFSMDYQNLKSHYTSVCSLSDDDFLKELPAILHLSCAICYIKGLSLESTIGDKGLIHELVHLLHIPDEPLISLEWVRELFKSHCKLA